MCCMSKLVLASFLTWCRLHYLKFIANNLDDLLQILIGIFFFIFLKKIILSSRQLSALLTSWKCNWKGEKFVKCDFFLIMQSTQIQKKYLNKNLVRSAHLSLALRLALSMNIFCLKSFYSPITVYSVWKIFKIHWNRLVFAGELKCFSKMLRCTLRLSLQTITSIQKINLILQEKSLHLIYG